MEGGMIEVLAGRPARVEYICHCMLTACQTKGIVQCILHQCTVALAVPLPSLKPRYPDRMQPSNLTSSITIHITGAWPLTFVAQGCVQAALAVSAAVPRGPCMHSEVLHPEQAHDCQWQLPNGSGHTGAPCLTTRQNNLDGAEAPWGKSHHA